MTTTLNKKLITKASADALLIPFIMVAALMSFQNDAHANSLINDNTRQFVLNIDNDVLFGTDREYTGGSHLYWTEPNISFNQKIFKPLFEPISKNLNAKTGQIDQIILATEVFTFKANRDSKIESIGNTGWTYLAFRHVEAYPQHQLGMELNLGWIGPASGGEEIQNGIHKLIGNKNETGWNHQYPDQPTVNVSVNFENNISQLSGNGFRSFYTLRAQLGNLNTDIGGGLGTSYASNCKPNFFDDQHSQLNTIKFGHGWGWFAYAIVNTSYEIYNGLLDGRLLTDDKPILRKRNFWPLFDSGIGLTYNQFSINYSTITTPKYYDEQPENRFRYSSLNFHWTF